MGQASMAEDAYALQGSEIMFGNDRNRSSGPGSWIRRSMLWFDSEVIIRSVAARSHDVYGSFAAMVLIQTQTMSDPLT